MVGQTVSVLCSKAGAKTILCSRTQERAERAANELNLNYNLKIIPEMMGDEIHRIQLCKDKNLIFTCGAPGVQLISATTLQKIDDNKIYADANVVPPLGIEGIDPMWKGMEYEKSYIFGSLSTGQIKLKVEKLVLKEMMEASGFEIFSFLEYYDYAKEILQKQKNK
jgi:hypothetical protein